MDWGEKSFHPWKLVFLFFCDIFEENNKTMNLLFQSMTIHGLCKVVFPQGLNCFKFYKIYYFSSFKIGLGTLRTFFSSKFLSSFSDPFSFSYIDVLRIVNPLLIRENCENGKVIYMPSNRLMTEGDFYFFFFFLKRN